MTVAWTSNGANVGDFVTFASVTAPSGAGYSDADFEREFEIQTVATNSFTITMASAASGTVSTNGSATATISILTGDAISTLGFGWGAGRRCQGRRDR